MPHIPALWYFDTCVTYPQWFRRVKFVVITPRFVLHQYLWNIAIQPAVKGYNSWANLGCSGCSPLGENSCETGLLEESGDHGAKKVGRGISNVQNWYKLGIRITFDVAGSRGSMRETGAYGEASGSGVAHEVGGQGLGMSRLDAGESRGEDGKEEGGVRKGQKEGEVRERGDRHITWGSCGMDGFIIQCIVREEE